MNPHLTSRPPVRIGLIIPPAWFDFTAAELRTLLPQGSEVMTAQMRFSTGFGYELNEVRDAASEVAASAKALAETGADLILQIGTPFSTIHGWEGGQALERNIEEDIGTPFEMMGVSVVRRLKQLGLRSVGVNTVYYDTAWTAHYTNFLGDAGVEVRYAGNFSDQGVGASIGAIAACHEHVDDAFLIQSVETVCALANEPDGIVIAGIANQQLNLAPVMELAVNRPVLGYYAAFARCLERLDIPLPTEFGAVLADNA